MKRKVSSVAKKVQVLVVATILIGSSVHAIADVGQEEKPLWSSQDKGTGLGALLGAIAGGPPGLVLGAFGGSLIGRHEGMQEQLAQSQQELVLVKQQLALLEAQQTEDEHEAEQESNTAVMVAGAQPVSMALPVDPLSVIEEGFSMTIHFRSGSHQLEQHYREQLAKLSQQLLKLGGLNIHLDGYADERGDDQLNRYLSEQRVCIISNFLQENGIDYESIKLYAHGEQVKLLTDSDAESRHFDRRVVITFSQKL